MTKPRKYKEKNTCSDCTYHMCHNICVHRDNHNCCDGRCTLDNFHLGCAHKACENYKLDEYFKEMWEFLDEISD